jgi:ribosomal protein S17
MTGIVTSNKMTKALVVTVFSEKRHPVYKKSTKTKKKYVVACDDSSKFQINQKVNIKSSAPISKTIRWIIDNN